jgi:phosphoribosylanthranilate isomerase
VRVKICGITRAEDAKRAADLGAWAVGFVFWPRSPRFIEPSRARAIVDQLPAYVMPVGVFVDQPMEDVEEIARVVRLGAVQLHGDESVAYARPLTRRVIKALGLPQALADGILQGWGDATVLLDATDAERRGGTGRPIDWRQAAEVARRRPVVLAGGLRPDNVAEAVRVVRPAAIDVSSGVERAPGEKDPRLMQALFAAVSSVGEGGSEHAE